MVSISSASKKTLVFLLCLSFFCRGYASVPMAGGWTLGDAVVQGATTTWNATKEVGGKIARGVASIKPTPAQVAKGLGRIGILGIGLTATQELLDAVDFVLDPANNTIKRKHQYTYQSIQLSYIQVSGSDLQVICNQISEKMIAVSYYSRMLNVKVVGGTCTADESGPFAQPISETPAKASVSAATAIIDLADKKDAKAQAFVSAVAQTATAEKEEDQIVPMSQLTQALDASQTITDEDVKPVDTPTDTTSTDTPTDTTSPTDTTDLPAFCTWAPNACAWFIWTKDTYKTSVQAITDYFKEPELDNKDDELELEEPDKNDVDTNISFGGTCPALLHVAVEIGGTNQDLELSFQPFCDLASFIKPIVILAASFSAALIIGGIRSSGDD